MEYKVVEQKAKTFLHGTLRAKDLEKLINEYASRGWELDHIVAGEMASIVEGTDRFYLIFKKDEG